jgi:hypothetical protein
MQHCTDRGGTYARRACGRERSKTSERGTLTGVGNCRASCDRSADKRYATSASLAPGRRLRTRVAGVFLFLPLLDHIHFEHLVSQASYPGSTMVPATRGL